MSKLHGDFASHSVSLRDNESSILKYILVCFILSNNDISGLNICSMSSSFKSLIFF